MRKKLLRTAITLPVIGAISLLFANPIEDAKKETGIDLPEVEWRVPEAMQANGYINPDKMPQDSRYSEMVILGNMIINETTRYIGPQAEDESMRYAGNNLSCASCHALGGTKEYQSGFVGVYSRFPQYRAREDGINTLENRINGCMQRSLNGKPLPINSKEMRAMVTYMQWLSQGVPVGASVKGEGLIDIDYIDRAADPEKGKEIYAANCAMCHQEDGSGFVNPVHDTHGGAYYIYPALWGDDSYNTGAGMYRLMKAAAYIKHSMPQDRPGSLSLEEAYDVAAYINSQPRPVKEGLEADFPDRRVKPLDSPAAPHKEGFTEEDHRYGPYGPMDDYYNPDEE